MTNCKKYDMIDIIIQNVSKELENMKQKRIWAIPEYSKAKINNAGKIIAETASKNTAKNTLEYKQALEILNNWRSAHAYPLNVITNNLRRNNPNAIVVQRLKRLDSIIGKIERYPTMSLYRMQDLGGCRVIVDSIDEVYESVKKFKGSKIRHIFKRENDYIENPKESGYRSYHVVYQFQSDKIDTYNKNILIEIQFRTKLQHIWATAVEMMGIYTKSNLKSSQGNRDVLRFFTLVSSIFAIKENKPICPNTSNDINVLIKEIKQLDKEYNIVSTLSGLNISIDYTSKKYSHNKNLYYILLLDYQKKVVSVRPLISTKIENATREYNQIENAYEDSHSKNVVLVSASSFDILKAAYPNYFVDISNFISILRDILN